MLGRPPDGHMIEVLQCEHTGWFDLALTPFFTLIHWFALVVLKEPDTVPMHNTAHGIASPFSESFPKGVMFLD